MAYDLPIDIFAHKWFHRILRGSGVLSHKYDVTELYKDECLAYPECNEFSDCDDLYHAISFRQWFFEKLYLEEIETQINEFRFSQADFYFYVIHTCNRVDLFGNLTIFERVFATSAFVSCLCLYCWENGYSEVMKFGDVCWAMYFDNLAVEFYRQGGWKCLKLVALSYKWPIDFIDIVLEEERTIITLIKIRNSIESYRRFKSIGKIYRDECISLSWVKHLKTYLNGSSDNFEDFYFNELKSCTEVENILAELKYFCDPNASEILKFLVQTSTTNSLEKSMANLTICDINEKHESKDETTLTPELTQYPASLNISSKSKTLNGVEKTCKKADKFTPTILKISPKLNSSVKIGIDLKEDPKSEYFLLKSQEQVIKTSTKEHLFEDKTLSEFEKKDKKNMIPSTQLPTTDEKEDVNKIRYDLMERTLWTKWKEFISNTNTILNDQMTLTEQNSEKENKTENDLSKEQDELKAEINRIVNRHMSSIRNDDEKSNFEAQMDAKKEQDEPKRTIATVPTYENNTEKNNNAVQGEKRNGKNECKIKRRKRKSAIPTSLITSPERCIKKENRNKTQDDTKKEQGELKDETGEKMNARGIETRQMSSNKEQDENESTNSAQKEEKDGEVKNVFRMLMALGDKQSSAI